MENICKTMDDIKKMGFASVKIDITVGNRLSVSYPHTLEIDGISISDVPYLIYRYQSLPGIRVDNVTITPNFSNEI